MTPAERHLTYLYLLDNLALGESLARQVAQVWYGVERPVVSFEYQERKWATALYGQIWFDQIRAVPSFTRNLIVCDAMKDKFELEGVAGFYFEGETWRVNLDPSKAAVVKPYRDADRLIQGLLVYSHLHDREPRLLTSRHLPRGSKAEPYYPERIAS